MFIDLNINQYGIVFRGKDVKNQETRGFNIKTSGFEEYRHL
ncbi:hypothetical protein [Borreliella mayonii]|nr:hypothetical protein [Borreliella mayonii]